MDELEEAKDALRNYLPQIQNDPDMDDVADAIEFVLEFFRQMPF